MSATTVVHCKRTAYDVYCGRPSKWGNPFAIGRDGTREAVIAKHARWLIGRLDLLVALPELRGRVLGCWCAPLPCHCDTLAWLADSAADTASAIKLLTARVDDYRARGLL